MKRYFAYLTFLNMLVNVFVFVPQILIAGRFHGTMLAIVAAVPIELVLMFVFLKSIARFPRTGLKGILESVMPRWIGGLFLVLYAVMFMMAGVITLLCIVDTSIRYISPETPLYVGVFLFLSVVCLSAVHRSKQILYLIEMLLLIDVPLIVFVIVKSFWNRSFDWDAVSTVAMNYTNPPAWPSLCAATFVFSEYANLIVFNKVFDKPVSARWTWLIGLVGFTILLSSFTIPIAFQGADGVDDYIFPWIITADSMRVELGFVERVLPMFLLLYAGISIASIIVHWHVATDLLRDALPSAWSKKDGASLTIVGLFAAGTLAIAYFSNEKDIFALGAGWIRARFPTEILLAILMLYAAVRRRRIA